MNKSISQTNRISYIEPNNLPAQYTSKSSNNIALDNITWNPEDLNISVDLQVIIPSRVYRESDNFNDYNGFEKHSILTGAPLKGKNEDYFLTDEYTSVSYQEIKNNNCGSSELLGINSIHISFDSHMYPRVSMNFTDVRGASLMMPQEQYVYDLNANKATKEDNPICKNFFQSFFKFPYPRFLLSIKGIYGTCVTFVLSVEDFKATFNSETGNFDVVVTFIGLMYGLYTDIPMNYLIMAPYIGTNGNTITNAYWTSKTQPGGEFFYAEKDGMESKPISTFFEFRNNYKDLVSIEQGKDNFVFGANIVEVTRLQEEILVLNRLKENFSNIVMNGIAGTVQAFEVVTSKDHKHIVFLTELQESTLVFLKSFVDDFTFNLKDYEEKYGSLNTRNNDVPGKLSHNIQSIDTNLGNETIFFKNDEGDFKLRTSTDFYSKISSNDCEELETMMKNKNVSSRLQNSKCAIVYDEDFKNKILLRLEEIDKRISSLEEGASEDMKELFRSSCNFTPTIENVMRMIFAHLDTFIHEYFSVIKSITLKDRKFSNIGWDINKTDVMSSGEQNAMLPPFAAFYQEKDGNPERIYPGEISELQNLDEVVFVEKIFSGLEDTLKKEAERSQQDSKDVIPDTYGNETDFKPIAITDFFYNGVNPYSYIKEIDFNTFWDFVLSRLYAGLRECPINAGENVIDNEIKNIKSSSVWNKIKTDNTYKSTVDKFYEWLKNNVDKTNIFDKKFTKENYNISGYIKIIKKENGKDYFKFDGTKDMRDDPIYSSYSRDGLGKYRYMFVDKKDKEYNKIESFIGALSTTDLMLITEFDKYKHFHRRLHNNPSTPSILQPLNEDGNPFMYDKTDKEYKVFDEENKNLIYKLQAEDNLVTGRGIKGFNLGDALNDNQNRYWVPVILDGDKNILVNDWKNNPIFNNNIYSQLKALYFLCKILKYEDVNLYFDYSKDNIFYCQNVFKYVIGGFLTFENSTTLNEDENDVYRELKKDFYSSLPKFSTEDEDIKNNFKNTFNEFVRGQFKNILLALNEETEYKTIQLLSSNKFVEAISPSNKANDLIKNLISDCCWILSFPHEKEKNVKNNVLFEIDKNYFKNIFEKLTNEIKSAKTGDTVQELNKTNNTPISHTDKSAKNSLYYTLKNLYDRWLSTYSEKNFRLRRPGERNVKNSVYSEFDNFLYVDSFYNDIGSDFWVNPSSFFDIVNAQIAGDTNFNVLEFIGKICEKNKLLFRCLPVYNNIYSRETFEDIFKPLSLYNGVDKLHRQVGNTYLLMYTYEPSNKLNLLQDKTNDVAYKNDSFDIADSFGRITPEAAKIFKEGKGENICAFGVTPGMQNQSYFTRVSVGMDNPRVTDFAIMNKFALAESVKGGRSEGIGSGQDMFSIYSNRSYDCNVEMLGCANIMPMMYFQLNNVPMFKGTYMITKVEHNIQNNTMTTKFTGTRLSRYYIPFNKSLFNIQALSEIINALKEEGTKNLCTIGAMNIEITNGLEFTPLNKQEGIVPQPENMEMAKKYEFNVWAAVNQMAQCLKSEKDSDPDYTPLTHRYFDSPKEGICATAVQTFLMAGFNGVFGANNKKQAKNVDSYRDGKKAALKGSSSFNGYSGYHMKDKLAKLGFYCIACGASTMDKMAREGQFQAGDVCTMEYKDKNKVGHVCMYSGKYWVSDFQQAGWRENSGKSQVDTENDTAVLLYRHPNRISKPQIYGYYKNGEWTLNYMNEDGFNVPEGVLRYENVVEKQK